VKKNRDCFLIDDDVDDQEIFMMALHQADPSLICTVAGDGSAALEKLERNPEYIPDFIFLDVNMPRMNGMQCLTGIKKMKHLHQAKIIMFSTSSEEKIINECKELGANEFMVKPTELDTLIDQLTAIVKTN
jgi:CheY-like chemotaxis protein